MWPQTITFLNTPHTICEVRGFGVRACKGMEDMRLKNMTASTLVTLVGDTAILAHDSREIPVLGRIPNLGS